MALSKKKIKEINSLSIVGPLLEEFEGDKCHTIGNTPWYDTPPEMWNEDERKLFDLVYSIETGLKDKILSILQS